MMVTDNHINAVFLASTYGIIIPDTAINRNKKTNILLKSRVNPLLRYAIALHKTIIDMPGELRAEPFQKKQQHRGARGTINIIITIQHYFLMLSNGTQYPFNSLLHILKKKGRV